MINSKKKKRERERERERKENAKQKQKKTSHVFYIFKSCVHRTLIGKMLRCL